MENVFEAEEIKNDKKILLMGNKIYFEGSLDELQDMYFENIETMEEENDPLDLIVSDGLREEMNFYKKAVGYIENEELEEL